MAIVDRFTLLSERVRAELQAACSVLKQGNEGVPPNHRRVEDLDLHLVEAMDALIEAAGVCGGKLEVLRDAATRHGLCVETASTAE